MCKQRRTLHAVTRLERCEHAPVRQVAHHRAKAVRLDTITKCTRRLFNRQYVCIDHDRSSGAHRIRVESGSCSDGNRPLLQRVCEVFGFCSCDPERGRKKCLVVNLETCFPIFAPTRVEFL